MLALLPLSGTEMSFLGVLAHELLVLLTRGHGPSAVHNLPVVFLTARPWAERGSRFTQTFFLTARPWAERGSRFTRTFFFFFSSSLSPDADLTRPILNHAIFNVYSPNVIEP